MEQILQEIIREIQNHIEWEGMEYYISKDENNELDYGIRSEHSRGFNETTLYTLPLSRWYWIDNKTITDYEVDKIREILLQAKEQE